MKFSSLACINCGKPLGDYVKSLGGGDFCHPNPNCHLDGKPTPPSAPPAETRTESKTIEPFIRVAAIAQHLLAERATFRQRIADLEKQLETAATNWDRMETIARKESERADASVSVVEEMRRVLEDIAEMSEGATCYSPMGCIHIAANHAIKGGSSSGKI